MKRCPGTLNIRGTPTLIIRMCPNCENEIELFSVDPKAVCEDCGFVAYNDVQNCAMWCRHARECIGDTAYEHLICQNSE